MTEMADEFGVTQMSEALMMNMNLSQNEEDLEVASDLPLVLTNPTMAIPYLTAVILALVSGVFGNIFILVMVFIKKTLRHSGYELMVNLACADLCVTGIADPLCILGVTHGKRWFEERPWLCEAVASLCLTACFCSFLSLVFLSVNRYMFIVNNNMYQRIFSRARVGILCIFIWFMAFTMEMGNFIGWGDHYFDPKSHQCIWRRTANQTYTLFIVVAMLLGLTMMLASYAAIFCKVWRSKTNLLYFSDEVSTSDKAWMGLQQALIMCRMMFMVVIIFGLCWIPYLIVISLDFTDHLPPWVHLWVTYIAHLHAAINWMIYGVTNPIFRQAFRRMCCHCDLAIKSDFSTSSTSSQGTVTLSNIKCDVSTTQTTTAK